jgi:hypothetical protein
MSRDRWNQRIILYSKTFFRIYGRDGTVRKRVEAKLRTQRSEKRFWRISARAGKVIDYGHWQCLINWSLCLYAWPMNRRLSSECSDSESTTRARGFTFQVPTYIRWLERQSCGRHVRTRSKKHFCRISDHQNGRQAFFRISLLPGGETKLHF